MKKARVIAFYLPQYHPIPENDEWWGKGFTEWTFVAKSRPLFRGHYQPHVPADLGFYDLRLSETRVAQAEMARAYGVEGFCYYHYWFSGKRLLERPFSEVLKSGEPDFPFCLCWANETWRAVWYNSADRILIRQTYPGSEDHRAHFEVLLKAFTDKRYILVDGKPLFLIYRPWDIPELASVTALWRQLAHNAGLRGLFLIGMEAPIDGRCAEHGLDGFVVPRLRPPVGRDKPVKWLLDFLIECQRKVIPRPRIYKYKKVFLDILDVSIPGAETFPCVIPNWDNTPRRGRNGVILHGSSPELFGLQVRKAVRFVSSSPQDRRLVFVKSWNEWAEGNHLEPDLKFGKGYLEALRAAILE